MLLHHPLDKGLGQTRFNEAEARAPRMLLLKLQLQLCHTRFNEAEARAPRMR